MRGSRQRLGLIAALAAFMFACHVPGSLAFANPPAKLAPEAQRSLRAKIRQLAEEQQFRGAAVVLVGGTNILAEGFGPRFPNAPRTSDESKLITADSLFEVASISKGFTVLAVLQLVEQGKLKLEGPLSDVFPEHFRRGTRIGELTLMQLLSHTTGLDGNSGLVSYQEPSRERLLAAFAKARFVNAPGSKFGYHNASYNVIAAVIEKASGQSFRDYMREHVFLPAGMKSTGILGDSWLKQERSIFRSDDPDARSSLDWPCGWGYLGAGGVVTSVNDLIAFEKAFATDAIISEQSKALLLKPIVQVPAREPGTSYSMGWFLNTPANVPNAEVERPVRMSHSGGVRGVRAEWSYIPDERVLIGAFTDESSDPRKLVQECERLVYAALESKRSRP